MTVSEGGRRRMGRRDFLVQYVGNSMLALGGSLFGAAVAYEVYSRRAEAGLSSLRRGNLNIPGGAQGSGVSGAATIR